MLYFPGIDSLIKTFYNQVAQALFFNSKDVNNLWDYNETRDNCIAIGTIVGRKYYEEEGSILSKRYICEFKSEKISVVKNGKPTHMSFVTKGTVIFIQAIDWGETLFVGDELVDFTATVFNGFSNDSRYILNPTILYNQFTTEYNKMDTNNMYMCLYKDLDSYLGYQTSSQYLCLKLKLENVSFDGDEIVLGFAGGTVFTSSYGIVRMYSIVQEVNGVVQEFSYGILNEPILIDASILIKNLKALKIKIV